MGKNFFIDNETEAEKLERKQKADALTKQREAELEEANKQRGLNAAKVTNTAPKIAAVIGLRILVLPHKEDEPETKGGIIIIEDKDKSMKPKYGTIFQVGGKVNTELQAEGEQPVVAGETIAYDRNTYPIVNVDGVEYNLIQKINLVGVCG